ncbi:MAG TPA: DUF192 domain-containing protein [Candidatus Nanoarchaeia archaeon]|nr:DUF192 domain-containing protein [Candidatus Nanoarchaeia archaeon]
MISIIVRKKKNILFKAKVYTSALLLAKGLRFSRPLKKNQALLLSSARENLFAIDMLFVFFPIDAVWLDKRKKIIHIVRNIKPFTWYAAPPRKAQYILECPANASKYLKVNQLLSFVVHQ